jgi:hypothetical protein
MELRPSPEESQALARVWESQSRAEGPALDFTGPRWPAAWCRGSEPASSAAEVSGLLREALGWPEWVRLYAKPALAVVAAARLAVARGLPKGVLWVAPGTGAPLEPPSGPPGVAVLRGDWAPDRGAMLWAQEEIRERGLLYVLDESATAFRLAPGGARERFGLEPDLALYGPALAGGRPFAALAGRGPAPDPGPEPATEALAAAASLIPRAARSDTAERIAELGRLLFLGLDYFTRRAGLSDEVAWEGPSALPRLKGRRLWAFIELAREEGLGLQPLVFLDPSLEPRQVPERLWPRLARAAARLKVLPEGEKAPLGWRDAAETATCARVADILAGLETES